MKYTLRPARVVQTILAHWRTLRTNWVVAQVTRGVLLLAVASLLFLLWRYPLLPPEVPLWYSRPWGEEQLAHPAWLVLLPIGGILWYGFNVIIATYVTSEYLIFTQVLFLSSFIVSLLSFITLIKILFLVT